MKKSPFFFSSSILFLTGLLSLAPLAGSVQAQSDAADRADKSGRISTVNKRTVLHLFGTDPKERGFAQGYLLAEKIHDDLDAALQSLPNFSAQAFQKTLKPWIGHELVWDADFLAEVGGVAEGLQIKLGEEGSVSKLLGHAINKEDLLALNAVADYFGPACSAFSASGKQTADGGVLHARTLDFPIGQKPIADQILIVSDEVPTHGGTSARKAWVAIGWPGLSVQFTGMNSDGLVVCLHDGENVKAGRTAERAVARGLLLRRMLEQIDPSAGDPAEQAAAMAKEHATACGNLFHLTWPSAAAEKTHTKPSAILEFDPSDRKVNIRRMDDSGILVLTNHFRVRCEPVECNRFKNITNTVETLLAAGRHIGLNEARKALMSAEQPLAAHSVYFYPDKLEFHVSFTQNNVMAPSVAPTKFTFKDLFAK